MNKKQIAADGTTQYAYRRSVYGNVRRIVVDGWDAETRMWNVRQLNGQGSPKEHGLVLAESREIFQTWADYAAQKRAEDELRQRQFEAREARAVRREADLRNLREMARTRGLDPKRFDTVMTFSSTELLAMFQQFETNPNASDAQ